MNELYKLLFNDKKRATTPEWDCGEFLEVNENGQVVNQDNETVNITKLDGDIEWIEYIEESQNSTLSNKKLDIISAKIDKIPNNSNKIDEILEILKGNNIAPAEVNTTSNNETTPKEDIVKLYYGISGLEAVLELFKNEYKASKNEADITAVLIKFMPFAWMNGRSLNTSVSYHRRIRSIIKEINNEYTTYALNIFKLPTILFEDINKANDEVLRDKKKEKDTFDIDNTLNKIDELKVKVKEIVKLGDKATLEDYKNTIGLIVAKQQTPERIRAYYISTYLALVTGRRMVDILKTMEYKKLSGVWYFDGLSKKRSDDDKRVRAFTLDDDHNLIANALKLLRSSLPEAKELEAIKINNKFNHTFNKAFKNILNDDRYTFHDARDMYSEIAYQRYGKNEDEELFKAKILGHKTPNLSATQHYMKKEGK